ncbi:testis specific protein Y-linked [Salminus brasiliensis]|uniref:testis specific protein Y-linked n=1 Tax=Salminus brasiliensis TaxID=930266 RepID=UPI003B83728F
MSATSDSSKPPECKKRSASPRRESDLDCPLSKRSKVAEEKEDEGAVRVTGSSERSDRHAAPEQTADEASAPDGSGQKDEKGSTNVAENSSEAGGCSSTEKNEAAASAREAERVCEPSSALPEKERSDSAAFAAAEALASLTGGGEGRGRGDATKEMPCSSRQALDDKDRSSRPGCSSKERVRERGRHAEAAVADSSSSLLGGAEREDGGEQDEEEEEEEEDDSLAGSSSTASSSVASDNEENEEGECAIVAVRMAPEVRQSVSLLAQVQMRLDALEKKGARLHQRLELKLSRQRRPHLDQRGAITQTIPGFWVTALLNHPHLSAHIDENDEDALSYMTNLEIETFKNNKLGYRICFHFRRNPFFQNKVIVKELHLGMGGSPVSFSNPILWHRGQNLIGNGEPRRTSQGVYQSFFHWFSDHSSPGRDDIAQILKDDLYRNPLRYYLTPLWEPRQNGSTPKPPDNSNGDECVIISDSDDDQEVVSQDQRQGREEEDDDGEEDEGRVAGADDSDQSSFEEREEEELDVEEVDDSRDSGGCEARPQGEEIEDIDVNEEEEEEVEEQS